MPLILIVDNEEIIRNILEKLNQALGYETLLASSSEQALQLLEQHTPDLILLDIMIPGSNSMDVITALKNNSANSHTGIIMISGTDNLSDIAAFIHAGADDFLLKPFNATLFKARISNALAAINHTHEKKKLLSQLADCQLKLQQAEMGRKEFCQELSHDLNNILTGIMMGAELLLMNELPKDVQKSLTEIIASTEQITALIKERRHHIETTES